MSGNYYAVFEPRPDIDEHLAAIRGWRLPEKRAIALEKLEYAATVITEAHKRTMIGNLDWQVDRKSARANLIEKIDLSINFFDVGPDSARWEYVYISSPVGQDATLVGNSLEPKAKYAEFQAQGVMLDQINQIFSRVLLEPRQQAFEVAMKKLSK